MAVAEACDEYVLYLKGQVQRDAALDASVLPVVARHENNSVRFLPILNGPAPYALLSLWQRGGLLVVQAPDTADHCPAQPLVQRRQVRPSTLVALPREGPSRPEPLLALGEVACVRPPTRTVCTTITRVQELLDALDDKTRPFYSAKFLRGHITCANCGHPRMIYGL